MRLHLLENSKIMGRGDGYRHPAAYKNLSSYKDPDALYTSV
jgi:hypothetical protein